MNVVFRVAGGDEAVEKKFAKEAEAAGLIGVKGHRSVGGMRASLYNAVGIEAVDALVGFMKEFKRAVANAERRVAKRRAAALQNRSPVAYSHSGVAKMRHRA